MLTLFFLKAFAFLPGTFPSDGPSVPVPAFQKDDFLRAKRMQSPQTAYRSFQNAGQFFRGIGPTGDFLDHLRLWSRIFFLQYNSLFHSRQ
jgi:hypothetical protein